jgi:hypothetical protein
MKPQDSPASIIVSWRRGIGRITDSLTARTWTARYGKDTHSGDTRWACPAGRIPRLEYNATAKPRRIRLDGPYKDPGGGIHRGALVLPSYSSLILIPV